MIRDPVSEVQFGDEEAKTRIVVHARYARRNDSLMHSDTLTLRLMSLSNACSQQKLDFEKLLHEKGKRREHYMQLDPEALIGVNSITGCDNIAAFFGKGNLKAVQLLQPMEGMS